MVDTVAFRALSQIATILGFVVLVRAMPTEDFGVLNLLYAFIPVISTVASLGLEQTLRRYQPEYLSAGNIPAARWLVRFVATARFGTNVLLLSGILLAWNWIAPILKLTQYRGEFAFFGLLVLLHFQARILQLSLAANMLQRFSMGSVAVVSIAKLIAYSGLAWAGKLTLPTAIVADTIAFGLAYALLIYAYRRHCPPSVGQHYFPVPTERKRLLRYGLLNNFNDAGTVFLSAKTDNFFLAAILDPLAVAVYAFYDRLREMLTNIQPLRLFDNVVQPMFFAVPIEEADDKIPRYFSLLLNTTLLLQFPTLVFAIAFHAELVTLVFGGKFGDYSALLPIVIGFATLNAIATPVTLVAQYEERAGIILLSKIFAVYNIIALLALIPFAGVFGAAIATGSSTLFKNLFIWWFARRRARWLNVGSVLIFGTFTWAVVALACELLKSTSAISDLGKLLGGLILCGLGMLIFVRTPAISTSDREILANVLRGREARILGLLGIIRIRDPVSPR